MVSENLIDKKRKSLIVLFLGIAFGFLLMMYIIGRSLVFNETPTLTSFAWNHFAGYLFFILSSVESFFIYMLKLGHSPYVLVSIAMATAMAGQAINYAIGYAIGYKVLEDFISSKKYRRYRGYVKKYGNLFLFLINFSPLSSTFAVLAAGMIKYRIGDVALYTFLGLLLKYLLLALFVV